MPVLRYVLLISFLLAAPAFAQRQIAVEISRAGKEPSTDALAAELRREIRAQRLASADSSSSDVPEHYVLIPTSELTKPHLRIQLLTIGITAAGDAAVFVSVLYDSPNMPLGGAFVRSMAQRCNLNDVSACAKRILVEAHATVGWFRDRWPALWKTL